MDPLSASSQSKDLDPSSPEALIRKALTQRVLILDGAMGTMIQRKNLVEADYRGDRFADHERDLTGNNELLSLTQPEIIRSIHEEYLEAGADIIGTNTFSAQRISQSDYGLEAISYELNVEATRLAKEAAEKYTRKTPDRPRYVAGAIGPTNVTLSISPRVEDPAFRAMTFRQVADAYAEQIEGLLDGGADLLLLETIFDTANAKAAIFAIEEVFDRRGERVPLMISMTITDKSGRTLSGQTLEAFWISVQHAKPLTVGINCGLGGTQMRDYVKELSGMAETFVSVYPNAGLPNEFGGYDEEPQKTGSIIGQFARDGWVNMVGGCCGTTPEHIRQIVLAVEGVTPRVVPTLKPRSRYAGLEPLIIQDAVRFTNIGERTNVTGSKRFRRLIKGGEYEEALSVARQQIENGANIIDINMDEGLLDSVEAMRTFCKLIAGEPDISRVPIMVDSSNFEVIVAGLECIQGKSIANSISLKEGEGPFREQARILKKFGAAAVVMAFDERAQATDVERRMEIIDRVYRILVDEEGFAPEDIIYDPNVLATATGIEEHEPYARDLIEAIGQIHEKYPRIHISGGISNLSFSFRGNDKVREAMHSSFLFHAIKRGLDMGIVNAGQLAVYKDIDKDLLERVEDVLFMRHEDATERLSEFAQNVDQDAAQEAEIAEWRSKPLDDRLSHALIHGIVDYIEDDLAIALEEHDSALGIIEGPLMAGMDVVGDLFGSGQMFLPQVVKSARAMKKGVAYLLPYMEEEKRLSGKAHEARGKILLATVKGDVHDIGKNIVGVVLGCNNYDVIDMGVMVPASDILDKAEEEKVDIVGLSGLITPSLDQMVNVAEEMKRRNMTKPLLIGGATTSARHTAVKIVPHYDSPVIHVLDASRAVSVVSSLLSETKREKFLEDNEAVHAKERERFKRRRQTKMLTYEQAIDNKIEIDWANEEIAKPSKLGVQVRRDFSLKTLTDYFDWSPFFLSWELKGAYPKILESEKYGEQAREVFEKGKEMLERIIHEKWLTANGVYGIFPAQSDGDDVYIYNPEDHSEVLTTFSMLRQQKVKAGKEQPNLSLADFVAPVGSGKMDYMGAFAVSSGFGVEEHVERFEADHDDYNSIMVKVLADRLAEAFAEQMHHEVRQQFGVEGPADFTREELLREDYQGIRPAPGYPACPEHTEKRKIWELLDVEKNTGMKLTESCMMQPGAAVSGWYFLSPHAHYFTVAPVGRDQIESYAERKNMSVTAAERWLQPYLSYDSE